MPTTFTMIQNKVYQFDFDYKNTDFRRRQLNEMTQQTFDFSFESWYQGGCWEDCCVPYSLFDGERMVSHVTASTIPFSLDGRLYRTLQLGTVMTDPDYRSHGLSRWLIEKVLADYQNRVDFVFLFANDSVLDFYPKFGFHKVSEYSAELQNIERQNNLTVQRLDPLLPDHREILYRTAQQNVPQYRLCPLENQSLVMLYCGYSDLNFLSDKLYYLPQMDAVAVASFEGGVMTFHDVLSPNKVDLIQLVGALMQSDTKKCVLGFIPEQSENVIITPFHEPDTTLFVKGTDLFDKHPLRVPITAHT